MTTAYVFPSRTSTSFKKIFQPFCLIPISSNFYPPENWAPEFILPENININPYSNLRL